MINYTVFAKTFNIQNAFISGLFYESGKLHYILTNKDNKYYKSALIYWETVSLSDEFRKKLTF